MTERHITPRPPDTGVWQARTYRWQGRTVGGCWHAILRGPGWLWEGCCRCNPDQAGVDLRAEQHLRAWLNERAAA